jgi:hypothetical protein
MVDMNEGGAGRDSVNNMGPGISKAKGPLLQERLATKPFLWLVKTIQKFLALGFEGPQITTRKHILHISYFCQLGLGKLYMIERVRCSG